jgi:calpain-7
VLKYEQVSAAFSGKAAGGNHTFPTYMYNPQYKLTVPAPRAGGKARVALTVQTARELPVNATVVWGKGERVFEYVLSNRRPECRRKSKLCTDSQTATSSRVPVHIATATRQRPKTSRVRLPPRSPPSPLTVRHPAGTYTVVVSAFEPTHQGPFTLNIASSVKVTLEPIPQEGSGMFAKTIRGEWCVPRAASYTARTHGPP